MSEFETLEALPVRVRGVRFNGNYDDLPAEARASHNVELNEFGWVIIHTPGGPRRLHKDYTLIIGGADDWYPISPAIRKWKYRTVDGGPSDG